MKVEKDFMKGGERRRWVCGMKIREDMNLTRI